MAFSRHSSLIILALMCFPFISTGLGLPWFYDFVIFYIIFLVSKNKSYYFSNKAFITVIVLSILSLINPILNSPSLEQSIIEEAYMLSKKKLISNKYSKHIFRKRFGINY